MRTLNTHGPRDAATLPRVIEVKTNSDYDGIDMELVTIEFPHADDLKAVDYATGYWQSPSPIRDGRETMTRVGWRSVSRSLHDGGFGGKHPGLAIEIATLVDTRTTPPLSDLCDESFGRPELRLLRRRVAAAA